MKKPPSPPFKRMGGEEKEALPPLRGERRAVKKTLPPLRGASRAVSLKSPLRGERKKPSPYGGEVNVRPTLSLYLVTSEEKVTKKP